MTPNTYDNTRLSDFKRCPRLFYFRHVLDWVPNNKRIPLTFGSAWHKAMEYVWAHAPDILRNGGHIRDVFPGAYEEFLKEWESLGMPRVLSADEEKDYAPRTPRVAQNMLLGYLESRARTILTDPSLTVIAVEKAFAVPVDPENPDNFYVGRIDKIVQHRGLIKGIEHKTTTQYKKGGPFRGTFLDSFSPNSQVDGYQYALHLLYPTEKLGGVWVDAALVHRSEEGFMFIPIELQTQMLDAWLWDVQYWIAMVNASKEDLQSVRPDHKVMTAFPKNTNSCFDFGSACTYIDVCKAWSNPVGKPLPPNMRIEHWEPLEHIGPLKDLDKLLTTGEA